MDESDSDLVPWHHAEVGPDDRTVTVRFGADFSEGEVEPGSLPSSRPRP